MENKPQNNMDIQINQTLYCNRAISNVSQFDFNLVLMHAIEHNVLNSVSVTMSPQHAKAMSLLLSEAVEDYEKTFGEINLK